MGVDCADVDGNGFPDIFVTNFSEELNTLYSNRGKGSSKTSRRRRASGSGFIPLGFGTKMFDFDNDGDLDIHVTNGHVIDNVKLYQPNLTYAQKDLLYENVGGRFRDVSAQSGPALQAERVGRGPGGRGLRQRRQSRRGHLERGTAAGAAEESGSAGRQLDHDPRPGHEEQRLRSGSDRAGADGGRAAGREINNVASYLSSNDIRLHVGLGTAKIIQQIEVLWPSGAKQTLKDVAVNQILTVKEP